MDKYHKLDAKWKLGVFLGRARGADQNLIGRPDGSVNRARAMVRVAPSKRWNAVRLARVQMATHTEAQTTTDQIEELDHACQR